MDKTLFNEPLFRRICSWSTALGLASMLASLAALRIGKNDGLAFVWHWSILLVIATAVFWNARFWKAVWAVQAQPGPETRRRLYRYLVGLVALGVASFLYPLRYIEQSYLGGIAHGLITAILFLALLGWIVVKSGQALARIDEAELARFERGSTADANG